MPIPPTHYKAAIKVIEQEISSLEQQLKRLRFARAYCARLAGNEPGSLGRGKKMAAHWDNYRRIKKVLGIKGPDVHGVLGLLGRRAATASDREIKATYKKLRS